MLKPGSSWRDRMLTPVVSVRASAVWELWLKQKILHVTCGCHSQRSRQTQMEGSQPVITHDLGVRITSCFSFQWNLEDRRSQKFISGMYFRGFQLCTPCWILGLAASKRNTNNLLLSWRRDFKESKLLSFISPA